MAMRPGDKALGRQSAIRGDMSERQSEAAWADEEFGQAILFDARRTNRLVLVAAQAARQPAGKITAAMANSKERQAAYGLLDSSSEDWLEASAAAGRAAFGRSTDAYVFVPVDQTSVSLAGAPHDSDFGPVGNSNSASLGLNVMSAIVVAANGTPIGSAAQHYWTRPPKGRQRRVPAHCPGRTTRLPRSRGAGEKETAHWLRCCERTIEASKAAGFGGVLWFVLDRGADAHDVLEWAAGADCHVTVRAAQNRSVLFEPAPKLWDALESRPVVGHYQLSVSAGPNRTARTATIEVRISEVTLALRKRGCAIVPGPFIAVLAKETSPVPVGEERLEWLLLTTHPGTTFEDAILCIKAYASRWRIEDAHKTWKSVSKVEETNLRSAARAAFWAVVLWSVALRVERLKHLARTEPNLPAVTELTTHELQAIAALKLVTNPGFTLPDAPTIGDTVRWIAEIGGYTGAKNSGGPPGSMTISRGLQRIRPMAEALAAMARVHGQRRDQ